MKWTNEADPVHVYLYFQFIGKRKVERKKVQYLNIFTSNSQIKVVRQIFCLWIS
jgi:hypothetical protein